MRLFEVADHFSQDLVLVLRNMLGRANSGKSSKDKSSMVINYDALSNIMKNMGYGEIDYDGFAKLFDANPELKSVVKNFDEEEIVLSTDIQPPNDNQPQDVPPGPSVDQMAHSAVNTPPTI